MILEHIQSKSNQPINEIRSFPIHALDPSKKMLEKGQIKINNLNYTNAITLHYGNSENMKMNFNKNNDFDVITMSFGIRNVEFRNKTLLEMKRLVRKGGRIGVMVS